MFMKQYNYKPRSNSQSSQTSSGSMAGSPPKDDSKVQSPTSPTGTGRRRSSAAEPFAGLTAHKRGSTDQTTDAKKASWADQKPGQTGILGGMWNSFTKGS